MYSMQDLENAKKNKNRFYLASFVLSALFISLFIYCIIKRQIILGQIVTLIFVVFAIFLWEMLGKPVYRYFLFLSEMFKGRSHAVKGKIKIEKGSRVFKDGLFFWKVIIMNQDIEKIYYLDATRQLPNLKDGQMVEIQAYENYIKNIKITER